MAIKHVCIDDYGYLAAGSVTGSFSTLLAMTDDADVLLVFNTLNAAVILQVPSKGEQASVIGTKEIRLPASASFTIDCRTNSKRIPKGVIKVKHTGSATSSGEICVTVLR